MNTPWGYPDFDAHEALHFVTDEKSGLQGDHRHAFDPSRPGRGRRALVALCRDADALTDALRLSRGMSYKNAMAGLPLGGGKAVVLADKDRTKTPGTARRIRPGGGFARRQICHRRRRRHDGHRHDRDCAADQVRRRAAGARAAKSAAIPARTPRSACSWASRRRSSARSARTASRACTSRSRARAASPAASPASRGRRRQAVDRRRRRAGRRNSLPKPAATCRRPDEILFVEADVVSPCALGAILTEQSIAALNMPIVAGGANNQLATPEDGAAAACARHPLRARLCHQRRRHHQRLDRISRRRRGRIWCGRGSKRFPAGSSRSGRKAPPPGATRPRSPTPWRRS